MYIYISSVKTFNPNSSSTKCIGYMTQATIYSREFLPVVYKPIHVSHHITLNSTGYANTNWT